MEELVVYEEKPLSAADVRSQVNLIQEVMKAVMQEGQHFGKIPGAGDKPTLLKPGAEKIMATFRLSADPEAEDLSFNDVIRYRVKCKLLTQSGIFKGAGLGECSSEEEKYKWRKAVSEAEYTATPVTHIRVKYNKDNTTTKQVRTNPYDLANTILKMAKKRALVDAVLTVTAASDIFTQDIEDMPEEIINQKGHKPPIQPPQAKQTQVASGDIAVEATIEKTSTKESPPTAKKKWILYGILADGNWYNTFNTKLYEMANASTGKKVTITYQQGEKGNNLIAIQKAGCTGNPSTCDISKYENSKAFCEDGTVCMFQQLDENAGSSG